MSAASKFHRLVNFFIDYLIICMITIFIMIVYVLNASENSSSGNMGAILYFIYLGSFFCYYFFMELLFQKTIGKIITGTYVVTTANNKPTLKQLLIRSWIRTISIEILSFVWSKCGHHDLLSETRVVKN